MKRLFTLFAFILLTSSAVFSQNCPADIVIGNRIIMNYATATEATAAFANISTVTVIVNGSPVTRAIDQGFGTGAGTRIRSNNGVGGTATVLYNGTMTMVLADGSTAICEYEDGVLVGSALPVSFLSFKGQQTERQIDLHWATASELNNEGFEVERGQEINQQIRWESIGFIEGNGTTQEQQDYSFLDKTPANGVNYYRLKQMDFDGLYEYSSTVAVEYAKNDGSVPVGIFPNPAREQLTLIDGEGMATIYNALGQPVKQLIVNSNQETISLSELHNGQYILRVLKDDGAVITQQFSKMN